MPVTNDASLDASIEKTGARANYTIGISLAVNIGSRLRRRLSDQSMSQSELARRVGVRQSTIHSLLVGDSRGSKHLHKIARELGTTPAYLSGEVDDPDLDAPDPPTLTHEQTQWLALFEALDPSSRAALMHIAKTMVTGPLPTVNMPDVDEQKDPS